MVKIESPQMYARPTKKLKPEFEKRSELMYCNKEQKANLAEISDNDLIILINHNTSENDTICMFDPQNPKELENTCHFSEFDNKKNYSLLVTEQYDTVLGNQRNKIGSFIFVIGGTTQSGDLSDNYILYPFWDENDDGKYEFNTFSIEIPQLNYPRENCTILVHKEILFVFYGNGKENESV